MKNPGYKIPPFHEDREPPDWNFVDIGKKELEKYMNDHREQLQVDSAQNEYSDNLTVLALAGICKGDFDSDIKLDRIVQRVMCNLLYIRYDSAKNYFGIFYAIQRYASIPNDKLLLDVLTILEQQTMGRFLLYMHYQDPRIYGWEKYHRCKSLTYP